MFIEILLFIAGLAFLIKGADYFVTGGSGLAARFGVSTGTIGLTVIAFGTSLPEFVVSINAIIDNNTDIALGNVIGSNIANIALVLAICAIVAPAVVSTAARPKGDGVFTDYLMMLAGTAVFTLFAFFSPIGAPAGIVFLAVFLLIILFKLKNGKEVQEEEEEIRPHGRLDYAYIIIGIIGVVVGSNIFLMAVESIAQNFGIPSYVIGISMVAVGTSLPELATSLVAIKKGEHGISTGNILGSNLFNLLFVMGIGSIITPIVIPDFSEVLIMVGFSVASIVLFTRSRNATRAFGLVLLAMYFAYIFLAFAGA